MVYPLIGLINLGITVFFQKPANTIHLMTCKVYLFYRCIDFTISISFLPKQTSCLTQKHCNDMASPWKMNSIQG